MGRYELKLKRKQKQIVDNKIRTRAAITKRKTNYRTETTPYHFYDLRSRRSYRTEPSSFRSDNSTCLTNFDLPPESCCSSNLTALNSTEFVQNFVTTPEITAHNLEVEITTPEITADNLEVESRGETSSKFTDCNKLSREIDGVDNSAMKSTVEIKPMMMMMMPSRFEIDDFFSSAEKDLQKRFSDKYNFDIAKDVPLEGRYEWVQIKP